jgi:CheY-like chemotaxis protein
MIVDDSDISRKLLNRLLLGHSYIKENKCKLYEAIDGLDAVSMIHNRIQKISTIFMDNIMPNITGILASKIIRGLGYNNLIFGITGNGLDQDIDEFINNGADYVFVKPFKKEKLDMVFKFVKTYGFTRRPGKKIVETSDKTGIMWADC